VNLVTEEKSHVAQSLDDYRGNYKYNLLDANLRAFNAEVPTFAQWDDHEVEDDWGPAEAVRSDHPREGLLLRAARGARAFHEFMPTRQSLSEPARFYRKIAYGPLLDVFMLDMRSYRGPNGAGGNASPAEAQLLGPRQLAWLKRELERSQAVWKVLAADLPIGLVSEEGIAAGDGAPSGRENEIAELLAFMNRRHIRNTIFITADVHYTAAHRYDPNKAVFQDFDPFWEFVSGPIHAGTWTPGRLDNTFGPSVAFQKASETDNLPPSFGLQFFGHVAIDGTTGVMTVTLKDAGDNALWSIDLAPLPGSS
jgi:alkaline phosphatase D